GSTSPVAQWEFHPGHFWMRGKRPDKIVDYDEELQLWNVYGYPESAAILSNPKVFSSDTMRLDPIKLDEAIVEGDFAHTDPPKHRRLRGLVDHAFTPSLVAKMESRVHGIIHELLDGVEGKSQFDLVAEFAAPLPLIMISDLLGVPESDRALFRQWMDKMLDGSEKFESPETVLEQEEELHKELELLWEMRDYWHERAAESRKRPREDLISQLVHAEVDGQKLNDSQISNIANRLLVNGHLTTAMLIANTMLCLDAFSDQDARVRADRSLVPALLEESMRYMSPICGVGRATNSEVEVAGTVIPKDQLLLVWTGAANRDERQFEKPDVFDAGRSPNAHLGFGRGIHFCLGRQLARMESKAAVEILLDRLPTLRADPANPPTFLQVVDASGVATLPVVTQ
uniref:Putative P450-like enzyme n=1 Tax=Streptomyces himastatinicus ATCC 53653 TaxID=457427 RepID=UPI00100D9BE1|nr:Chain A, Putative P450-like enzyme [Streptomyces himastatinicus ATCC 53653]